MPMSPLSSSTHQKRIDFLEAILQESTPAMRKKAFVISNDLYEQIATLMYASTCPKQVELPFAMSNETLVSHLQSLQALKHKTRYFKALQLQINTMQPECFHSVSSYDSRERRAIRLLTHAYTTLIQNRLQAAQQDIAILKQAKL